MVVRMGSAKGTRMSPNRKWKRAALAAGLAASLGLLAACGGGGSGTDGSAGQSGEGSADGPTLIAFAGTQTPVVANFNPYSPTALHAALGGVYEPLFFYNKAEAREPIALLGESTEWSEDGTELTIKIRDGVKWNDGEPLTSDDIKYSFTNEGVQMDYVEDVEVIDDTSVKLHFNQPSFTNEYSILGATYIVPEHVFSGVSDLVTFDNATTPVGTGPFMVENVTDAAYTMVANPDYWDAERPGINRVQYLGIDGNSSAESLFKAGELDYSTFFVPQPDALVKPHDLGYLNVASPNPTVVMICSNAELGCTGAQTHKEVRQALNLSINRGEINEKAYYNLAQPASPTFVKPDRDEAWVAEGMPLTNPDDADPAAAKEVMEAAGWTLGSDGIYEKDGERASIKLESVEGWSDQNAAAELMVSQAKAAGIELQNGTITNDQYSDRRMTGDYQLFTGALFGTPISDPFTIYRNSFTTDFTQPVGTSLEPNQTNYSRYSNPAVDEAVAAAATTNDTEQLKAAYAIVQENIVEDVPYISLFHGGSQTFFNQTDFTGWPTEDDLYAFPASWDGVSAAYILSKLSYK